MLSHGGHIIYPDVERRFDRLQDALKMIIPILITISGAFILTTAVTYSYFPPSGTEEPEPINPIQEPSDPSSDPVGTAGAAFGNALIYVTIALIGGVLFVILLKKGLHRIMEIMFASVMGLASFFFSLILFPALLIQIYDNIPFSRAFFDLMDDYILFLILFMGAAFAILNFAILGLHRFRNEKLHNTLMILFGMGMGSIFGVYFDSISLIVVLLALSVYDIYAVFYGPLREMFETLGDEIDSNKEDKPFEEIKEENTIDTTNKSSSKQIDTNYIEKSNESTPLQHITELPAPPNSTEEKIVMESRFSGITLPVYMTPSISIGLGDFVFFSVLIAKAVFIGISGGFFLLKPTEGLKIYYMMLILPFIGILLGSYITFRLLEKREILPALPIPLFCGLIGFFMAILLQI
ncbi:MAG: hypothetical protein ACXAC7_05745 [Candidatus Hodarchaeales archaeon]|jgi:presenilin-like A22 family membrane protease